MKWRTVISSFGIGNLTQANSITGALDKTFGWSPWIVGIFLTLLSLFIIVGGIKSISKVSQVVVPLMAVFYILAGLVVIVLNYKNIPAGIGLIVKSAFSLEAFSGAGVGIFVSSMMQALKYGVARGVFSNEAGMGSAAITAAAATTDNPVRQGYINMTGTFWDTVVICALTGIVLVSSIIAYPDITYADGAALTKVAFSKIPYVGAPLLAFGILTFAFSTIIGWSYYGESAVNYLEGRRTNRFYRILFIVSLFFGSIINLDIIWNIADCMNALMAIPNLIALLLLSGVAAQETKKYLWSNRLDDEMEEVKDEI